MIHIRFLFILMLLSLDACTNMDRVAPMSWTYYLGNGASESEIRVALLECGSNVPGDVREFHKPDGNGFLLSPLHFNDSMLIMKCMQNSGFTNREFKDECNHPNATNIPACKPHATIPKRSVENRLNSPYCHLTPKAKICQPEYDHSKDDPNKRVKSDPKSIPVAHSTNPATQLKNQVLRDSNSETNQLLQQSGERK